MLMITTHLPIEVIQGLPFYRNAREAAVLAWRTRERQKVSWGQGYPESLNQARLILEQYGVEIPLQEFVLLLEAVKKVFSLEAAHVQYLTGKSDPEYGVDYRELQITCAQSQGHVRALYIKPRRKRGQ